MINFFYSVLDSTITSLPSRIDCSKNTMVFQNSWNILGSDVIWFEL